MKASVKVTNRPQSGEVAGAGDGEVVSGEGPVIISEGFVTPQWIQEAEERWAELNTHPRQEYPATYMNLAGNERRIHVEMFIAGFVLGVILGAGVVWLWSLNIR